MILTYEHPRFIEVVEAVKALCGEGQAVIYRAPYRWLHDGVAISNAYESRSLSSVCEEKHWNVAHDLNHVAVIEPKDLRGREILSKLGSKS